MSPFNAGLGAVAGALEGSAHRCRYTPAGRPDHTVVAAVGALAAVETMTRLGRRMPVRVLAPGVAVDLVGWPERIRWLDGAAARAAVSSATVPTPAAGGEAEAPLVIVLDLPAAAADGERAAVGVERPTDGAERAAAGVERPTDGAERHAADRADGTLAGAPAVVLTAVVTADEVEVAADCDPGDPWLTCLPAVAEIFAEVVAALLADASLAPAAAPGLSAISRAVALGRHAAGAADPGPLRPVPAMIEDRVDLVPHRPAVTYDGRVLTYRQLDELANGLAGELTVAGVRPGDVVPVLLADGLELPVAYLALMKLGAAFVPVDPAWPGDRLATVLRVLAAPLVLGGTPNPPPGGAGHRWFPVAVEAITPTSRRPGVEIHPEQPIYGIFTSGTTGVPKCAINRHAGLSNRFRFMTRYFAATGEEVVLQNSGHTFDSSVWQLFWPLTTGGRVVLPARRQFLDLERVVAAIAAERVTITDFVPSIFNVLVAMADRDPSVRAALTSLRHLVVGGEEINPASVHRLRQLLPGCTVTNGYGPTEASIGMIFHRVSVADGDAIPIGTPIDNCHAVVVDPDLRPLPPGATGEILIGGACLGTGYLGSPGRTASAFVPNHLPELPGQRLYRTGDLGHLGADGRFRFAGRRDHQVKINGVRVELGEIETAAARCPGVREARAIVGRRGGQHALAVFAAAEPGVTENAVRDHLRRLLPRTTLPRYVFVLAALPLGETGKVDRSRLRALLDRALADDAAVVVRAVEPRTQTERLRQVFRGVLGRPDLASDDDFFAAGGDSLQAVALALALSDSCGVHIGVQDLVEHPTAARMAAFAAVATGQRTGDEAALMARDARPPADLVIRPAGPVTDPATVLLTGATGFVGTGLLHELLTSTPARVCCLVRADDDERATDRVVRALAARGMWRPGFAGRVTGYAADLSRPRLGLAPAVWDRLGAECEVILHNGALVNFLYDYRAHRAANVGGTAELLRLAMRGRPKPLHHISTLGVLDTEAVRHSGPLAEDHDVEAVVSPHTGYSRSKWVAERLLAAARRAGASVTVYRLGEVMPGAVDGQPNHRALSHLLLAACQRLGMRPAAAIRTDYTPVDYAARRVVAGLRDPAVLGRDLHVVHPASLSLTELPLVDGQPLPEVPCGRFLAALRASAADGADRDVAALLALLPSGHATDEEQLRQAFAGLLVDNASLFRRDECERLERRWGLADQSLAPAVAAYRSWLARPAAEVVATPVTADAAGQGPPVRVA